MHPDPTITRSYYLSALTALRFLDARGGQRRFGPDADARWSAFAGDDHGDMHRPGSRTRVLGERDRIDLLLRDADAQWPGAFGARVVFDLSNVAQDDAFGAEWTPAIDGRMVWNQATQSSPITSLALLIGHISALWDTPLTFPILPPLHPGARWLLHGPAATAAAILAFSESPAALWHQQVIIVAEPPGEPGLGASRQRHRVFARQLAALAAALLGQQQPTRIVPRLPDADEHPGYARLGAPTTEPHAQ